MLDAEFPPNAAIMANAVAARDNHVTRSGKASLSDHQKQVRYLTGMAVGLSVLFITVLLWFINRPGF